MKNSMAVLAVGIVALGLGSLAFSGVLGSGEVKGESATRITFGALAPLSGQVAVLGERMRNGMELAREDAIAEHKLESFDIIYEDACDGKTSTNAVQKLLNADGVKVISSSFCLFGEDAVIPTTEAKKVIFFNTAANPDTVLNKKYVFSTNFTIRNDSENIAQYVTSKLGAKRVAVVYLDTSFGEGYKTNLTDKMVALGGEVVATEAAPVDATDFRTALTKIKAKNPDVLVIIHFGSSLGSAIKQVRELGMIIPIVGDYESEDPTVLQFAGAAAEGFIISSSLPETETKNVSDFATRYKAKYGDDPDVLATNAYDAVRLQADAYVACSGDTDCMAEKLSQVTNYDGVSGRITINPSDHSVEKPNVFKVVKGGKFVTVGE